MKLTTLRPRLATLDTSRAPTLTTENASPRPRGQGWMDQRLRIQIRDHSACARCGLLWRGNQDVVDHRIPRWAGGTDDDSNLWLLHSKPCHDEKSAGEEAMRRAGSYTAPEWVGKAWQAVQARWTTGTRQHHP